MKRPRRMLGVSQWRVPGETFGVELVESLDQGSSAAEVNFARGVVRLLRGQPEAARAKRLGHELAHCLGFDEAKADAAEALVGLLIDHGVIVP